VRDLVRLWISCAVQPELLTVQTERFLINRESILGDR